MFGLEILKNRIFQDRVKNHSEIDEEPKFSNNSMAPGYNNGVPCLSRASTIS
jgi:hypothetical protein